MTKLNVCQLRKIGDLLAIPLFLLLIVYLLRLKKTKDDKKEKYTLTEKLLLFFAVVGLVADVTFSVEYLMYNGKC
jgi:phosphate starvation-inducible membrane PsiE